MAKARIVVTRTLPPDVEARIDRDYDAARCDGIDNPEALARLSRGAVAVLTTPADRMDAACIAALPDSVRGIATFSVGYDHIDLRAAAARGLAVTNTPDVLTDATADLALLLILAAARRAGEGERMLRSGGWTGWAPTQLLGRHLGGARLGIFGMGRIGSALARRALALGMAVHYHNRRPAKAAPDGVRFIAEEAGFLGESDILSLHAPLTPQTDGWLNAARIEALPPGAIVVNTGRGGLVEDAALIAALKSGRVAAAGLDVYRGEPALDPGYLDCETAVLLPHLGSATIETRNAMGFRALDNIDALAAGRAPPDPVTA